MKIGDTEVGPAHTGEVGSVLTDSNLKQAAEQYDVYDTIVSNSLVVAQGWVCSDCKLMRPFYLDKCICKKHENNSR